MLFKHIYKKFIRNKPSKLFYETGLLGIWVHDGNGNAVFWKEDYE